MEIEIQEIVQYILFTLWQTDFFSISKLEINNFIAVVSFENMYTNITQVGEILSSKDFADMYKAKLNIFSSCTLLNYFDIISVLDVIHKFTRDSYLKRFPELESLISDPLQYVCTVKVSKG